MSLYKRSGSQKRKALSLANGSLSGTLFAAVAGNAVELYSITVTSNVSTPPLVTISDTAGSPTVVAKGYPPFRITGPLRVEAGLGLTIAADAIAAGTVEVSAVALYTT